MNGYNEIDCTRVDFIETELAAVRPGLQPELLGTVRPPTNDADSTEGQDPREGTDGILRVGNIS